MPVVGEHPHAGRAVGHRAEFGQLLPGDPDGDRPDRADVGVPVLLPEAPDLLDHAGGVGDRRGVGHRVHRGEPAERGGLGAGLHGLGVLPAGLAQMGVQVDQAGQRDQPVALDDVRAGGAQAGPDLADAAVGQQQVDRLPAEGSYPPQQVRAHSLSPSVEPIADSLPERSR